MPTIQTQDRTFDARPDRVDYRDRLYDPPLDEQMAGQVVGRPGIGYLTAGLGERNPGQRRSGKIDLGG